MPPQQDLRKIQGRVRHGGGLLTSLADVLSVRFGAPFVVLQKATTCGVGRRCGISPNVNDL